MDIRSPPNIDPDFERELVAREKYYSQEFATLLSEVATHLAHRRQVREGLLHLDIRSNDEHHRVLFGLPLFPYMDIRVAHSRFTPPMSLRQNFVAAVPRC